MKEISLTKGQVALVDDEDFERVNAFKWQARWTKSTKSFYAKRFFHDSKRVIDMARFIINTPMNMVPDHINHNTLDNRKCNLRNSTRSQNNMNAGLRKDNKLRTRCIHVHQNRFRVEVMVNKKRVFRKCFGSLEEAIVARDEVLKIHFGEFVNL